MFLIQILSRMSTASNVRKPPGSLDMEEECKGTRVWSACAMLHKIVVE